MEINNDGYTTYDEAKAGYSLPWCGILGSQPPTKVVMVGVKIPIKPPERKQAVKRSLTWTKRIFKD